VREVGVAFPNDEASAQVIASRLRAAGIAARVDRGLAGSYQVTPRAQMTVLVDERHVKRAHEILGTQRRPAETPEPLLQFGIVLVVIALAIGAAMIVVLLAR
jgi:hypothetical protein